MLLRKRKYNLISATSLGNYVRNDPIIDYLDIVAKNNYELSQDNFSLIKISQKQDNTDQLIKKRKTSFDYIVENGYKFEEDIIKKIQDKMCLNNESNRLYIVEKILNIDQQFENTKIALLSNCYDIILGGLLINNKNSTYGYPDMIVTGKWINTYIIDSLFDSIEISNNKYYIIDIKSSTINLINGGQNVSSSLLYEGYKSQIWIYKEALDRIFNLESSCGFILGKRYKYILNKKEIIINDPFKRLGIIDYNYEYLVGNDINKTIINATKWKKDLNKNWKKYKVVPPSKKELYPNMKNTYDKNYKKIKKRIAKANKEITLMWNCGIKQRKLAFNNEITKYNDPNLDPTTLGFTENSKKYNIINMMLKTLHSDKSIFIDKKNNNYMNWQNEFKQEFFVDFETYNSDLYDENNNQYENSSMINQIIYMIGVGRYDNIEQKYIFKCFIINYDKCKNIYNKIMNNYKCDKNSIIIVKDEIELIEKFTNHILSFKKIKEPKHQYLSKTRLIHWSNAETIIFNKKIVQLNFNTIKYNLPWFDLLSIFKYQDYPIIIKECFSFSLKDIVKSLNNYNLINLEWSELDDGLLSAFIAKDIYNNIDNNKNNIKMEEIVEYNYIDCIAIYKLLNFIRNYNTC